MNLTLHLTNKCNLKCTYCFVEPGAERMSQEVAFAAVDLVYKSNKTAGILFYGGEPLLEKELIYDIVNYSKKVCEESKDHSICYRITTNGTLLDEDFLEFSKKEKMLIGFSHDGHAQDDCRLFHDGKKTFDLLKNKIPSLLKYHPYTVAMSVMNPSTVHKAASTAQYLFDQGFRYITLSLNYSAKWTKNHLKILEEEYKKMAELYFKWSMDEEKFYLSPFEMKILSHLKGDKYNEDRHFLGQNQPSVAPNGKIYLCSRHLNNPLFEIGDVFSGIDEKKHQALVNQGLNEPAACQQCTMKHRCNYICDCLVSSDNQIASEVLPMQCANEQIITPIVDKVAGKLYEKQCAMFIHKHYNELYPIISFIEDGNDLPV